MTIEDVRKFWSARPCNIGHSQVSIGEDPLLFSRQVTERKYFVEPHIPGFAQFERWKEKQVLEIGSGIGTDALEFAAHGAYVTACDVSSVSVEIARKRARAETHRLIGGLRFSVGNGESSQLFPGFYDLVYSFGALHHTPRPDLALRCARQSIKSSGELRIMVYNRLSWKVLWILATYGKMRLWKWKELIPRYSEAQTGCPITHTYTKRALRKLLSECGFETTDLWVDHIFPYRIGPYREYHYERAFPWCLITGRAFRAIERLIGWHLLAVARPI